MRRDNGPGVVVHGRWAPNRRSSVCVSPLRLCLDRFAKALLRVGPRQVPADTRRQLMGWLASFTGLRKVGAPPLLAAAAVVAVFLLTRLTSAGGTSPETPKEA